MNTDYYRHMNKMSGYNSQYRNPYEQPARPSPIMRPRKPLLPLSFYDKKDRSLAPPVSTPAQNVYYPPQQAMNNTNQVQGQTQYASGSQQQVAQQDVKTINPPFDMTPSWYTTPNDYYKTFWNKSVSESGGDTNKAVASYRKRLYDYMSKLNELRVKNKELKKSGVPADRIRFVGFWAPTIMDETGAVIREIRNVESYIKNLGLSQQDLLQLIGSE